MALYKYLHAVDNGVVGSLSSLCGEEFLKLMSNTPLCGAAWRVEYHAYFSCLSINEIQFPWILAIKEFLQNDKIIDLWNSGPWNLQSDDFGSTHMPVRQPWFVLMEQGDGWSANLITEMHIFTLTCTIIPEIS